MDAPFKSRAKCADAAFAGRSFSVEQQWGTAILLRPAYLSEFPHRAEIALLEIATNKLTKLGVETCGEKNCDDSTHK